MDSILSKLLGAVPFPFSSTDPGKNIVDVYYNSSMAVIDAPRGVDFPLDSHAHSSYEFLIPMTSLERIRLDNNTISVDFNKIAPINPEQEHGTTVISAKCKCFAWNINEEMINRIAYAMYGKSKVSFENCFIPVSPEVALLLTKFMGEYKNGQPGMDFVLDILVRQIIITLLRQVKNNCSYVSEKHIFNAHSNIDRTIEFLHDNYQDSFSLQEIAKIANLSPYHFLRLFKRQTGKTPYAYLMDIKIEKAKALLSDKKHTVTEVCFMCGFNNTSHFATTFKKKAGLSPSDYRKL